MHANASDGAKVLPIARISIRNTGMFRTTAEARGKSKNGLQPPIRLRSHDNEGAYASENKRAVSINEVTVALPKSRPRLFIKEKVVTINNNANNHEQREIESNFISGLRLGFGLLLLDFGLWPMGLRSSSETKTKDLRPKTSQRSLKQATYLCPPNHAG